MKQLYLKQTTETVKY